MGTKVKTCVVVGASPTTDSAFIKPILKQADYIICADGGWNHVHLTGVCPHLIVGDFDSACDIIPKETESISGKITKIVQPIKTIRIYWLP